MFQLLALLYGIIPMTEIMLTTITGSMADVPKDLMQEIKRLEQMFTVDTAKLKEITDHFVKELEKGMYHATSEIILLTNFRSQR